MSVAKPSDVRAFLTRYLDERLREQRRVPPDLYQEDYDLLLSGVVDSLGFIEMLAATAEHFSCDIDLTALDPEKMTVIGDLSVFIAGQMRQQHEEVAAAPS
jgi:acyl carrier protein